LCDILANIACCRVRAGMAGLQPPTNRGEVSRPYGTQTVAPSPAPMSLSATMIVMSCAAHSLPLSPPSPLALALHSASRCCQSPPSSAASNCGRPISPGRGMMWPATRPDHGGLESKGDGGGGGFGGGGGEGRGEGLTDAGALVGHALVVLGVPAPRVQPDEAALPSHVGEELVHERRGPAEVVAHASVPRRAVQQPLEGGPRLVYVLQIGAVVGAVRRRRRAVVAVDLHVPVPAAHRAGRLHPVDHRVDLRHLRRRQGLPSGWRTERGPREKAVAERLITWGRWVKPSRSNWYCSSADGAPSIAPRRHCCHPWHLPRLRSAGSGRSLTAALC